MTAEPKRIQVVRSHQDISEFAYNRDRTREPYSQKQLLLLQQDYSTLGWKRLNKLQSLPLKDNWPITLGNAAASFSSGFLGECGPFKVIVRCGHSYVQYVTSQREIKEKDDEH